MTAGPLSARLQRLDVLRSLAYCALLVAVCTAAAQTQSPAELYRDAVTAYDRGDTTRAIALYQELLRQQPDSVQARTNLGVALARMGRYSEAASEYQEALKRDPQNAIVRLNLALAWYKQADFERAAAELETIRRQAPDNQQSLYLLADCYLRLGKNQEAVALLDPAYQSNPNDRAVVYALGLALIRSGQAENGAVVIDRILKDGNTAEANLLLGTAQYSAGEFKTAAATLRKAVDLNPNVPGGWSLLGRALLDAGENESAKTAFRRALDADPNDFDANLYLGGMLRHDGNLVEAAPYLERAHRLRFGSVQALFQIGELNLARGELDKAQQQLEQTAREWPDFQEVHVQLAVLYSRLHRVEDSKREREIVLKLNQKSRKEQP